MIVTGIHFGGVSHAPAGHFYCDDCDSEWTWYHREEKMICLDAGNARDRLPSTIVEKNRFRREVP